MSPLFRLISIFNEQELELLLSGLPDINIDDLKSNSEYHKYTATSLQIVWWVARVWRHVPVIVMSLFRFWRALRSFDQTDRAKFLQFVTGSSKVPLQVRIPHQGKCLIIISSGFRSIGRNERSPEIPDPPRRQINRQTSSCSHLLQPTWLACLWG